MPEEKKKSQDNVEKQPKWESHFDHVNSPRAIMKDLVVLDVGGMADSNQGNNHRRLLPPLEPSE